MLVQYLRRTNGNIFLFSLFNCWFPIKFSFPISGTTTRHVIIHNLITQDIWMSNKIISPAEQLWFEIKIPPNNIEDWSLLEGYKIVKIKIETIVVIKNII